MTDAADKKTDAAADPLIGASLGGYVIKSRIGRGGYADVYLAVQTKLEAYIEHRLWREERVCEALRTRAGASPEELVEIAYSDVAPALYPLAERSLRAHLAKLETDGRARRRG